MHSARQHKTPGFDKKLLAYTAVVSASLVAAAPAQAGFIGAYAFGNWTTTLINSNGLVFEIFGPPGALVIDGVLVMGSNTNVGGLPGTTDFTIAAVGSGLVNFDWRYSSDDVEFYDQGGFLLNGVFNFLAANDGNPTSRSQSFAVTAGDLFGFRVLSTDNTSGPGLLAIRNFEAPGNFDAPIPEPTTLALLAAGAVGGFASRRRART